MSSVSTPSSPLQHEAALPRSRSAPLPSPPGSPAPLTSPAEPVKPNALAPVPARLEAEKAMFHQAQCVSPHDAGVFVGNLPKSWDDDSLTDMLKSCLQSLYGPCYVKVGRNTKAMNPWALVQFQVLLHRIHTRPHGSS